MSYRKILSGTAANLYGQVVTIATQLLGIPVLIASWGLHDFGLWTLMIAVPTLLITIDFGYAAAAAAMMNNSMARNDTEDTLVSLHSAHAVITGIVIALFVIAAVMFAGIQGRTFEPIGSLSREDVGTAAAMTPFLLVYLGITLNSGLINAVWRVNGRYPSGVMLYETGRLIEQGAVMVTAWVGGSLAFAAITMVGVRLLSTVVSTVSALRLTPWVTVGFSHCRIARIRELFRPAMGAMLVPLCILAGIQGVTFAVGFFLSPALAGAFATIRVLYRMIIQVVGTLTRATVPDFSTAFAKGDVEGQRRILRLTMGALLAGAIGGPLGVIVLGPWFISVWTHGAVKMTLLIYLVMGIHAFFGCMWNGLSNLLTGLNLQTRYVLHLVGWNLLVLSSLFITMPRFGLDAAAISLAVIDTLSFVSVWMVWCRVTAHVGMVRPAPGQWHGELRSVGISEVEATETP